MVFKPAEVTHRLKPTGENPVAEMNLRFSYLKRQMDTLFPEPVTPEQASQRFEDIKKLMTDAEVDQFPTMTKPQYEQLARELHDRYINQLPDVTLYAEAA